MSPVREFYQQWYANQEQGAAGPETEATFGLRVRAALCAIGDSPKRVLDFGCGTGAAAKVLVDAGHTVAGVDVSASGIRLARKAVPSANFELIESETDLTYQDGSFDVCFCSEVIEHLLDVQGFVCEIHRVLAPEGIFLVTTPYHGWFKNAAIITFGFDRHFDPAGGHIRFFSKSSLTQLLEGNGFNVRSITGVGRKWPLWKSMFVIAHRCD